MKKLFLSVLVALVTFTSTSAQDKEFYRLGNRIGVAVGGGTEGISVEAAVSLNKYFHLRAGMNMVPSSLTFEEDFEVYQTATNQFGSFSHEGMLSAEATLERTTMDVKLDFYPFPNSSSFFISGGLSFGGAELMQVDGTVDDETLNLINRGDEFGIDFDGYNLPIDENGYARATAEVSKVRPYVGIGFGRAIPKKRIGLRLEIGAQFQGTPKIKDTNGDDLLETVGLDEKEEGDIVKVLDYMKVYPCIKLSIRGRIF